MANVGAIILTAGEKTNGLDSLYIIEGKTVIDSLVEMLEKSGIAPITLVLGDQKEIIEKHFQNKNVRIVFNPYFEHDYMIESIKLGIRDLEGLCSRILIVRPDIPAFSEETLEKLIRNKEPFVRPVYEGRAGNPVLIGSEYFEPILSYEGGHGLLGLIEEKYIHPTDLSVDDPGVLLKSDNQDDFASIRQIKAKENNGEFPYRCLIDMKLRNGSSFFNAESALLLNLIDETHSIKSACDCMHISYSKAWTMIRLIENETGIQFVIKKIGGYKGGNSVLTEKGREFVNDYQSLLEKIQNNAEEMFEETFRKYMGLAR